MDTHYTSEILRNILLANPLTSRGQEALLKIGEHVDEKKFMNDCYIEPFSSYKSVNDEIIDPFSDPDYKPSSYAEEKDLKKLHKDKENFETNFWGTPNFTGLVDSLFIIKGVAGCGKTTYLHKLLLEKEEIFISEICDLEKASNTCRLITNNINLRKYNKSNDDTVWKFISITIPKINILLSRLDFTEEEHKNRLSEISKIYNKYFEDYSGREPIADDDEFQNFFEIVREYAKGDCSYSNFGEKINAFFNNIFVSFPCNFPVEVIIGILIRLYFCMSKSSSYAGKKFICAIDNIERYVDNTRIQDVELQVILTALEKAITDFATKILKIIRKSSESYSTSFGILVAMRDTSANIKSFIHYSDEPNQVREIDISEWYNSEDIYKKKLVYFSEICNLIKNENYYIAFNNIISDVSVYKWGMKNLITHMYNRNHRRIATNVIMALDRTPDRTLKIFINTWNKASESGNSCLKHLCRRLILRILLDYVQERYYFDDLIIKTSSKKDDLLSEHEKYFYTRRIVTFLYRVSLNNGNNETYISLPKLIKQVLCRPHFNENEVTKKQINYLARILYTMNKSRSTETNWAPLVVIKFDYDEEPTLDNLYQRIINIWGQYVSTRNQNLVNDTRLFSVKITDAGRFFARVYPDFEYFACRHKKDLEPLLAIKNSKDCRSLITTIKEQAFECIDAVIYNEKDFFGGAGNSRTRNYRRLYSDESWLFKENANEKPTTHPIRIIRNHIGYLTHYLEYIKNYTSESDFDKSTDKDEISRMVEEVLKSYREKEENITSENVDYFSGK